MTTTCYQIIQGSLPSHFTFVDILSFERYLSGLVSVLLWDHESCRQLEVLLIIMKRGNVAKDHQVILGEVKADMRVRIKGIIRAKNLGVYLQKASLSVKDSVRRIRVEH